MNILAINTAFSNSDVAIFCNNKKDYISIDSCAKQSENILVCIDDILKKQSATINDIDTIACVVGPGSFTGIRIGVGLVKGMAVAKPSLKLVSIMSLDLLAKANKDAEDDFWCAIDALSGNVFVCKYNKAGQRLTEPKMLSGDFEELEGEVVGLKQESIGLCTKLVEFSPELLLQVAMQKVENNEFVEENNLLPVYLRKSQAEIGLEDGNKKN